MGSKCTKQIPIDNTIHYIVIKDMNKTTCKYIPRDIKINERLIGNNDHCYGCNSKTQNYIQVKIIDYTHWFEVPNEYIKIIE